MVRSVVVCFVCILGLLVAHGSCGRDVAATYKKTSLRHTQHKDVPFGGFSGHHFGLGGGHHASFSFHPGSYGIKDPAMQQVADILKGILKNLTKKRGGYTQIAQTVVKSVEPTFPKGDKDFKKKLSASLVSMQNRLTQPGPHYFMNAVAADYPNLDMNKARTEVIDALKATVSELAH